MNTNTTSTNYNRIKGQALDLITMIRDAQRLLGQLHENAAKAGLNALRKEGESELDYLARLATEACDKEHEMKHAEARTSIAQQANGLICNTGPRTVVGRVLNRFAQIAG
jgi:hypothetical protein